MDKILKEINLDDFTGRLATKIPSVEAMKDGTFSGSSYTDWGQLPYDVVVYLKQPDGTGEGIGPVEELDEFAELSAITENLPLFKIDVRNNLIRYGIRYKTMCYLFGFIRRCFKNARYYRICSRNEETSWIEVTDYVWEHEFGVDIDGINDAYELAKQKFFAQGINMISNDFPDIESALASGITGLCILTEYEEFEKRFKERHYCEIFYEMVESHIHNQYDVDEVYTVPYTDIPLCITSDNIQINRYHPCVLRWVPNKRFYVHQQVWFDGDSTREAGVYMLIAGDGKYDECQITKEVYDANSGITSDTDTEYASTIYFTKAESGITTYWCKTPYYKGHYNDSTHITEFDDGENSHWVRCKETVMYPHNNDPLGIGPSYFRDYTSKKIQHDRNGESYPFILSASTSGSDIILETALPYYFELIAEDGTRIEQPHLFPYDLSATTSEGIIIMANGLLGMRQLVGLTDYPFIRFTYISNYGGENRLLRMEAYQWDIKTVTAPIDLPVVSGGHLRLHYPHEDKVDGDIYKYVEMPYDGEMEQWIDEIPDEYYGKTFKYTGNDGNPEHINGCLYTPVLQDISGHLTAKYVWEEVEYDDSGYPLPTTVSQGDYLKTFRLNNGNKCTYYICYPEIPYVDIDYSTTYSPFTETTESGTSISYMKSEDGVFTTIFRYDYDRSGITMENATVFADDANLYSADIYEDINVIVDRGTSAAVEKHNILGEINTFQDLLAYKNNYFNIEKTP